MEILPRFSWREWKFPKINKICIVFLLYFNWNIEISEGFSYEFCLNIRISTKSLADLYWKKDSDNIFLEIMELIWDFYNKTVGFWRFYQDFQGKNGNFLSKIRFAYYFNISIETMGFLKDFHMNSVKTSRFLWSL